MSTDIDPNKVLGNKIIEVLLESGLISKDRNTHFKQALVEGKLKEADWKVALETIINDSEISDDEATEIGS